MASWTHRKFATLEQALDYLNGVILGSLNLHANGADVDGKALIIHDGGANRTVAFAPPKGVNWTIDEIVVAINAGHANLAGSATAQVRLAHRAGAQPDRRLQIAGTVDFTVRGDGTANAALGFAGPATPANDTIQSIIPNTEVVVFRNAARDPNQQWELVRYA